MERILIEIRDGNPVHIISTSPNISIEFLDYDWVNDGGELIHTANKPDEIMSSQTLNYYVEKELANEKEI